MSCTTSSLHAAPGAYGAPDDLLPLLAVWMLRENRPPPLVVTAYCQRVIHARKLALA